MQTPSGQRVHVQANAAQLRGVASGMQVQVTGAWQARPTVAAAAAAAAPSSSFVAASVSASGAKFVAPKVTVAAAGPTVAAAAVKTTVPLSSNQVVTTDISTIFIPSECRWLGSRWLEGQKHGACKLMRGWRWPA